MVSWAKQQQVFRIIFERPRQTDCRSCISGTGLKNLRKSDAQFLRYFQNEKPVFITADSQNLSKWSNPFKS